MINKASEIQLVPNYEVKKYGKEFDILDCGLD